MIEPRRITSREILGIEDLRPLPGDLIEVAPGEWARLQRPLYGLRKPFTEAYERFSEIARREETTHEDLVRAQIQLARIATEPAPNDDGSPGSLSWTLDTLDEVALTWCVMGFTMLLTGTSGAPRSAAAASSASTPAQEPPPETTTPPA